MTCLPWVTNLNNAPWTTEQPIYPRRVDVHRFKTPAGVGDTIGGAGYSGTEQGTGIEGEVVLFVGLPAAIQMGAAGRTTLSGALPADAVSRPIWNIFIPSSVISIYSIRDRDMIIDDEGYRHEVSSNYWTAAGYQLSCVRQEA